MKMFGVHHNAKYLQDNTALLFLFKLELFGNISMSLVGQCSTIVEHLQLLTDILVFKGLFIPKQRIGQKVSFGNHNSLHLDRLSLSHWY